MADFNGDRKLDILWSGNSGLYVFPGNGNGTVPNALITQGSAYVVAVADFTGDGIPDVIAQTSTGKSNQVSIFLGKGDGTFSVPAAVFFYEMGTGLLQASAGDFNGDGKMDLLFELGSGEPGPPVNSAVLLGNGNGTFQSALTLGNISGFASAIGDFNGDSIPT